MNPANADRFSLPKSNSSTRFPQQAESVLAVKFISCRDIFKLPGDEPDRSDRQQHVGIFSRCTYSDWQQVAARSGKELRALVAKAGEQVALLILRDNTRTFTLLEPG